MTHVEKAREIIGHLERLTTKHLAQLDAMQDGQLPNPPVVVMNGIAVALSQLPPAVVVELLAAAHKRVVAENVHHWQELQQIVNDVLQQLRSVDDPPPAVVAAPLQQSVQQPVQQYGQQQPVQQPTQHTLLDFVQRMQQEQYGNVPQQQPHYRTEAVQ